MSIDTRLSQVATAKKVPVRIVDCDVHPTPRAGELDPFIDEPYRSLFANRRKLAGNRVFYDPPDFKHSRAMRTDTFPDDGNFAGSDPELMIRQLFVEGGSDIAILGHQNYDGQIDEERMAALTAVNRWQDACWLDGVNNWHGRFYGSIMIAHENIDHAVRQIEEWAEHPHFAQILIDAEQHPSWGHPRHDPIWATATKHGLPVSCHVGRGQHNELPMSPVGFMSYNHDFMVSYSMLVANQVMSLIFDGVFDRFPNLQVVLIEHGFNWILPLMWRMDAIYEARGPENGLKRKPSEYVRDHIWFTTQPLDYPEDKLELTRSMEWMGADRLLLFSSDYPHWSFDDPQWVVKHLPEQWREKIMFQNAIDLFHLPSTVTALEGQKRIF